MNLERAQLATVAALAAASFVSIFATQLLLDVGILLLLARILGGRARFPRTPLDGPILAFCLWTLLSASFSSDPAHSHDSAKKLLLFLLFYLAVDTLASPNARHRVLTAALLGGLALSSLTIVQYFLLGFDTLNVRPRGFLGHYMSASGLTMGVVILSAARLAFARTGLRVKARDGRLLAGLLGALVLVCAAQAAVRPAVIVTSFFVLGLAVTGGALALSGPRWPDASTATLLAALALPLGSLALLLSQTRNAWLGAVAGLATVAVLRAPRTLWLLAAAMLAVLVVRPATVMNRLTIEDESSRDRYYMWQAGIDMILDKPVFGQGPGMILAGTRATAGRRPRIRGLRIFTTTRSRSPPSGACPASSSGSGGWRRRWRTRGARRGAGPLQPWPLWARSWPSWWPGSSSTISATPKS